MTLNMNPRICHVLWIHTVSGRGWAAGSLVRSLLVKGFRYAETSLIKLCNPPAITKYITFSVKIVFHNVSFLLLCLFC